MEFYLSMGRELDHSFTEINKMPENGSGIWMTATCIGKWFLSNEFLDFLFERVFIVLICLNLSREDIKGRCRSRCNRVS